MKDKEKIVDTLLNEIVGVSYRYGGELVEIISKRSGVDYKICYELLEDVVKEINISYANRLLKYPLINMGNGFHFTANFQFCNEIAKKLQ